jgi:transcriptional regulator with XRE-family HTH domain
MPAVTDQKPKRQNGGAIRDFREKDGQSQAALAKRAGMRQSNLSMIENEQTNAPMRTLCNLARLLGIPVSSILRERVDQDAA